MRESLGTSLRPAPLALAAALVGAASCGTGDPFRSGEGASGSSSSGAAAGGSAAGGSATGGSRSAAGTPSSAEGGDESFAGASPQTNPGGAGQSSFECEANTADCNEDPDDGCEASLDSDETCGACDNTCPSSAPSCTRVGGQYVCSLPAPLTSQRLELPCLAESTTNPQLCRSVADTCPTTGKAVDHSFTLGGSPEVAYDIKLRIRGVLEPHVYTGGTQVGDHFYVGGAPLLPSGYNTVSITVSAPAKTYYLNLADAKGEIYQVFNLDYTAVITANGGAKVSLGLTDPDCALVRNCQSFTGECAPYVPAGVPPAPMGFNGQFVQLDLLSLTPAP